MTDQTAAVSTRLINTLIAGHEAGRFTYAGTAAGRYRVEVHGRRRDYPVREMTAWLRGFDLGEQEQPDSSVDEADPEPGSSVDEADPEAGGPPLDQVRSLLVNPSLADACRIAIRAAMEDGGLTVTELATRVGASRGGVAQALRFGRPGVLSLTMAESLMAGCGGAFDVRLIRPGDDAAAAAQAPVAPLAEARPEPAGLRRARALLICHDHGLVRWPAPSDPNKLLARTHVFTVRRGSATFEQPATVLEPWLLGLADASAPYVAAMLTTSTPQPAKSRRRRG